jgi:ATP-binding cassette subfamily G (WHITE) protein 8 (sterolin 2)
LFTTIVPQFDYHLPSLTVLETLQYQARLRLPVDTDEKVMKGRVYEVLRTLGLSHCAGVQVGGAELKGISGGEKRRLSIGVQLLGDPSICLFDEPTTGLDAFTARHIVQTLKELAFMPTSPLDNSVGRKRTVILSIHQPRYDIFACIDEVTLLSRGELVWSGPVADMMQHFASLGHPCPELVNPADFILDLSSIDVSHPPCLSSPE